MLLVLKICNLDLISYREAWELQRALQKSLMAGDDSDYLLVCRHPEVITLGRSTKGNNVLADSEVLKARAIEIIEIERGGDTTWHGPGQIILYPILNLNRFKRDVSWYLRNLEEVIIRSLRDFNVPAKRIEGCTGVWLDRPPRSKIAAMGIRISRWCTMHGLSLNVENCQAGFNLINPCGFKDIESAELISEVAKDPSLKENLLTKTKEKLLQYFCEVFNCQEIINVSYSEIKEKIEEENSKRSSADKT
jgi:lipoyl(octanoyl) transferase